MVGNGMQSARTYKEYIDLSALESVTIRSGVLCLEFKENNIPLNNKLNLQGEK